MTIGGLARPALPHVLVGEADPQVGAVGRRVVQAVEVTVVEEAQVLLERRVVQLPCGLRVLAIRAGYGENRAP